MRSPFLCLKLPFQVDLIAIDKLNTQGTRAGGKRPAPRKPQAERAREGGLCVFPIWPCFLRILDLTAKQVFLRLKLSVRTAG